MAGAGVVVQRNFGSLEHLKLVTPEMMRDIGLLAREMIVTRTRAGVDVDGQAFEPYSEGYAEAKRKALGTSAVNLTVSGGLLNDLTIVDVKVEEEKASVTLGWTK